MRPSRKAIRGAAAALLIYLAVAALAGAAPPGTPELIPNDPSYLSSSWPYRQIDAPAWWAATLSQTCSTKVAVLDSIPAANPDLPYLQLPGASFGPGGGADTVSTVLASIIDAATNNGIGVAGLTNCPVVPVGVSDPDGYRPAWLTAGINWAAGQPGVRVIYLPFTFPAGGFVTPDIVTAIQNATAQGILVVISAGDGSYTYDYQGTSDASANALASANPEALRVAGVDLSWQLDPGSNHGPWVDIAAPYVVAVDWPGGTWGWTRGTRLAAAVVAAVAAKLFDFKPGLTPDQVKRILMTSGTGVPGLDVVCQCVINAYKALIAAGYVPPSRLTITIGGTGSGTVQGNGLSCKLTCTVTVQSGATSLTATPSAGSVFAGWQGSCAGVLPTCRLGVFGDTAVTAVFAAKLRLTVHRVGNGMVTSQPAGIACSITGQRCLTTFAPGVNVTLTAKPSVGWTFSKWLGACHGTNPICRLKLAKSASATAVFAKKKR